MFELLGELKPLFLMHLPDSSDGDEFLTRWAEEIIKLKKFLESQTGAKIEEKALWHQIKIYNEKRRLLKKVMGYCSDYPVPISGLDMLVVMESKNYRVDLDDYMDHLRLLCLELQGMKKEGRSVCSPNAPRILLTGCPIGSGSEKVLRLIEECGGIVVCQEHCTGIKSFDLLVDENEEDPYTAMAHRYLRIPCSCMTPNKGRINLLGRLIDNFKVQGVVDLIWQSCHTYNIESYGIKKFVEKEYQIPLLHIETDYSQSDTGQLGVRIEAFLEMLTDRKKS
jgi:benzoyl-CoA reductase/2-hydroxyglutaryl-CoA dehydratase subunit BcrC/BadD/HgdB